MIHCSGYAAHDANSPLTPFSFERRDPGPHDVQIDVLYCGVCGSDLHRVRDDWNNTIFPIVPGHEIVGRVVQIGDAVTKHKVGDIVGIGVISNSCQNCAACNNDQENYCENGPTSTYNAKDRETGEITRGGYSNAIVAPERFVHRVPASLDPASVAPLLCGGITMYSALRHWQATPGKKVGIVGIGGLGHIGVKIAKAMGLEPVAFTSSSAKEAEALRLGASSVIVSTDEAAMQSARTSFDLIVSTVPNSHDLNPYLELLKTDGTLVSTGLLEPLGTAINFRTLASKRRSISASYIGGMAETQEMLDFCAKHGIVAEVEKVALTDINSALDRLAKGDVHYRFVIDMSMKS